MSGVVKHGLYSATAAEKLGSYDCETPDGSVVRVTVVMDLHFSMPLKELFDFYMWPDARYVGVVTNVVKAYLKQRGRRLLHLKPYCALIKFTPTAEDFEYVLSKQVPTSKHVPTETTELNNLTSFVERNFY